MSKTEKVLSPQVELFCSNYVAIGSPTFNHKEKSALAAKYAESSARNSATALLRSPEVQQRIRELNTENLARNNTTIDSVLTNLQHDRQLARDKGDVASAVRVDEIEAKFMGMLIDRGMTLEPEKIKELSEKEVEECQRIANIRLRQG